MIVLVFRAARGGGPPRLRGGGLIELNPPKLPGAKFRAGGWGTRRIEVESVLRQELKRITQLLQTKDSSITELENGFAGKQQLLQRRSEELDGYKSKADSLTGQLTDLRLAKERAENILQQERKKMKLLQSKESVITELEKSLTATQELLQSRSAESEALKSKINTLTEQLTDLRLAKERTESILQKKLKKTEVLQAKDFDGAEQESALTETVRALEKELSEKQEILQTRTTELKAAKSKINTLRERLAAMGSAKKQTELLQAKDAAMKELQESSTATAQALEQLLNEKEKLSKDRAEELKAFGSDSNTPTEWG